mgnify:FL=1
MTTPADESSFDGLVALWQKTWAELQAGRGASERSEPLNLLKSIRAWVELKYGEQAVDLLADRVRYTISPYDLSRIPTKRKKKNDPAEG